MNSHTHLELKVAYDTWEGIKTAIDRYPKTKEGMDKLKARLDSWKQKECYRYHRVYLITERELNI